MALPMLARAWQGAALACYQSLQAPCRLAPTGQCLTLQLQRTSALHGLYLEEELASRTWA